MKKFWLLFLSLGLFLFFGCGKRGAVIARIGPEKITVSDLENKINSLPASYRQYLATESGKRQYLENLIKEEIVLVSARKAKIHRKKEYTSRVREFTKELNRKIKDYKEQLLLELYLTELNKYTINVTSEEVRNYYQEHIADFRQPRAVGLSHILLATAEQANETYRRLKKGADFARVAAEVSIDPSSAGRGGDLGIIQPGGTLPELEEAIKQLKIGEISLPVKTQFGYHILKKTSEKSLTPKDLATAEPEIRQILLTEKFNRWLAEQDKKLKVRKNYDRLSQVQIKLPTSSNYFLPSEESNPDSQK